MIDSEQIRKRMKDLGVTTKALGEVLGLKQPTVSQKINKVRPMFLSEAEKIAEVLDIKDEEFCDFFFARERKPERKKECRSCKRWAQFYTQTYGGPFMKAEYGLCIGPGHQEVREPQESCEEHRYSREEDRNAEN